MAGEIIRDRHDMKSAEHRTLSSLIEVFPSESQDLITLEEEMGKANQSSIRGSMCDIASKLIELLSA